jgi:hypothetical protein
VAGEVLVGEGVDALGLLRSARLVKQARLRSVACADWVMLSNKALGMMAGAGLKTVGIHRNTEWVEACEGRSMTRACVLGMAV